MQRRHGASRDRDGAGRAQRQRRQAPRRRVSLIEIQTFELVAGADTAAFVAADARVQTEVAYRQAGLVRRTTALGSEGEWVVITLWASAEHADAAASALDALRPFVDTATVHTARYTPLD